MRHRLFLLSLPVLFLFSPLLTSALDSAATHLSYKFVVTDGEPVTLNASDIIPVKTFEECVGKCEADQDCILAYQANSTDPCYLFEWNSITQVTRNESGGVGTVAFKVYTDQPTCDLNMDHLLNGKTYPIRPNDTTQNLWRIDTAETGWTITYIGAIAQENLICGNFTFQRPYADSCNPECNLTMVQIRAIPGPMTGLLNENNATNWNDCLYFCYGHIDCFTVQFFENKCTWYNIENIFFWNKTEASYGSWMAIKLPLSNKTCSLTQEKLLDGPYYLPFNHIKYAMKRSFFQMKTTPKYFKILKYLDENQVYFYHDGGCEENYVMSVPNPGDPELRMCHSVRSRVNLTQAAAKEICEEWGAELVTERYVGYFSACLQSIVGSSLAYGISDEGIEYGIPGRLTGFDMWVGLERDNVTQQYKWPNPEYAMTKGGKGYKCSVTDTFTMNSIAYTWAPGQPDTSPGMDCAYLKLLKLGDPFPAYGLYSSRCDVPRNEGFACATPLQKEKGIPPFLSITEEYGVVVPPIGGSLEGGRLRQITFDPRYQ